MLKYYKQEMRDLREPKSGRVREVYKVSLDRSVSGDEFMEYMTAHSPFTIGATSDACLTIASFLGELLAAHGSVTLPGIGTFSVGIRAKEGAAADDEHDINARSLEVSHINFRASKALRKDVGGRLSGSGSFQLDQYGGHVPLYEPDIASRRERFAKANEYIAEHGYMRIADYASLTGLSYSAAQRELSLAIKLDHSGLAAKGRGSHRVYVRD
ncbi:MAG: hypothetical protein IJ209_02900 [Bacteroidaceae bacterium]|nr:hypothetical protein [Bacteroidaceae bacterium]